MIRKTPLTGMTGTLSVASRQLAQRNPRTRKCAVKGCQNRFVPRSMAHKVCGADCSVIQVEHDNAKKARIAAKVERMEHRAKVEDCKPLGYWLKRAERACNTYIRARDADEACISCGATESQPWQAGHYISVGANKTLRFNEDNIHKQCVRCNMHLASNAVMYRIGIIKKIGLDRVELLEGWHDPVKMTKAYAQEIEATYKAKLKEINSLK